MHTLPTGGSGSSCAGCHGSRPGDTSQFPVSSAQSGRWSGGDIRRIGLLRYLRVSGRLSIHER